MLFLYYSKQSKEIVSAQIAQLWVYGSFYFVKASLEERLGKVFMSNRRKTNTHWCAFFINNFGAQKREAAKKHFVATEDERPVFFGRTQIVLAMGIVKTKQLKMTRQRI